MLSYIMNTFFINLDNATSRREKFKDTEYIRWRATPKEEVSPFVDDKMISMYSFKVFYPRRLPLM